MAQPQKLLSDTLPLVKYIPIVFGFGTISKGTRHGAGLTLRYPIDIIQHDEIDATKKCSRLLSCQ
jgi:hypothetical protein